VADLVPRLLSGITGAPFVRHTSGVHFVVRPCLVAADAPAKTTAEAFGGGVDGG
jgi:hypothetical protein